jgi:TPR repeat protein
MADKAALERARAEQAAAQARLSAEKAAQKAAEKAAERPAFVEPPKVALAAPTPPPSLYEQAEALEREGKGPEAVRMYLRAARAGSGKAAKRLGEIYDKGIAGVARDYAESLKWLNAARVLGEDVPPWGGGR